MSFKLGANVSINPEATVKEHFHGGIPYRLGAHTWEGWEKETKNGQPENEKDKWQPNI